MNRAAEGMLERSDEVLLEKTIWDQFPALDTDVKQLLRRVMLSRAPSFCETYYAPCGRWFSFHVNPFREGISVLFRNISERRNAEVERERLIRELQAALAKRPYIARPHSDLCLVQENSQRPRILGAAGVVSKEPFESGLYPWDVPRLREKTH
jgi:hypothetical protein